MAPSFESTFLVSMTCQSCIDDISKAIRKIDGIEQIKADLDSQIVQVTGTAPLSAIVAAIQTTGRDAIVRGSGKPNGAAVCILETHAEDGDAATRGLVRMVQVGDNQTVVDLTLRGVDPGRYVASIHASGNIAEGPESTGSVWGKTELETSSDDITLARGFFGNVEVNSEGHGTLFIERPFSVWEVIGRSVVVKPVAKPARKMDPNSLVGVIARSAGVWENDKMICSCSGQTVWEERRGAVEKGMI